MKNQMMKSKRGDKNHHFKILQGESQKLKDKLETLKEQIKLKKQQKIMNTTSPSINPYTTHKKLTQAKMNQTNYSQKQDKRLNHLLADLKIQNIEQKLKDRHIYQIQQLFGLKDEEIDNWKDVGVGYRIKLKKFIQKNRGKEVNLSNIDVNEKGEMHNIEMNSKNIEEIIKNRNNDKYYVPINRQQQQIQHDYPPQLTQYEQEKMMLSILSFLGGKERSTSIKSKKTEKSSSRKHVHWSKEVQQLQSKKNQQKKYPKEIISKKILTQKIESIESPINKSQEMQQQWNNKRQIGECQGLEYPDYRYCWSCLKRIIKQIMRLDEKQFCSCQCLQKYQQTVNPVNLLYQFEQTQLKYNAFVESKDDANEEQSLDLDIV